jgi:hypothetical protein
MKKLVDCKNAERRKLAAKKVQEVSCKVCNIKYKRKCGQEFCSIKCQLLFHVKKDGECWLWEGSLTNCGYGKITIKGIHGSSHRISFEIFKGQIPKGKHVCHNCPTGDNKRCINPDHLWIGSHKDNMQDALKKGRMKGTPGIKWSQELREKMKSRPHSDRRGEKHHLRKLTNANIYEIRELLKTNLTQKKIAEKYGIDKSLISYIKSGKNWSHI